MIYALKAVWWRIGQWCDETFYWSAANRLRTENQQLMYRVLQLQAEVQTLQAYMDGFIRTHHPIIPGKVQDHETSE